MKNEEIRKTVVESLLPSLNKKGFIKKGNTLISQPEHGLYQIIQFTLGPTHSMMANHIGVGFGITTEEWIEGLRNWKRPKILTLSDCEIIDHNCKLLTLNEKKTWYSIPKEGNQPIESIKRFILVEVLPILERLNSREKIIAEWAIHKEQIGLPPRHELSMGILHYLKGDKAEGERLLRGQLMKNVNNEFYKMVVERVLGNFINLSK